MCPSVCRDCSRSGRYGKLVFPVQEVSVNGEFTGLSGTRNCEVAFCIDLGVVLQFVAPGPAEIVGDYPARNDECTAIELGLITLHHHGSDA